MPTLLYPVLYQCLNSYLSYCMVIVIAMSFLSFANKTSTDTLSENKTNLCIVDYCEFGTFQI